MKTKQYIKLKQGEYFYFFAGDLLYLRCRGGCRLAVGGELYTPRNKSCLVILYNP